MREVPIAFVTIAATEAMLTCAHGLPVAAVVFCRRYLGIEFPRTPYALSPSNRVTGVNFMMKERYQKSVKEKTRGRERLCSEFMGISKIYV